jgi:hypothetical protein
MSEILPLDPDNLTPSASLNRVRIVDVPGIKIDPQVRGKTGYDLLSLSACAQLVHAYTADLGLTEADEREQVRFLEQGLQSDDMRIRCAAEKVGMQLGRRLGYLLTVLKRGDPVNRLARSDWDASYWKQWAAIRDIFLGGGIVQGRLGSLMCEHATHLLAEAGVRDCILHIALHPSHLPLIGAARSAPGGSSAALVFDFGNSFIKRGYALYHQETLTGIWLLPPVPVPVQGLDPFAAEGGSPHPRLHQFAVFIAGMIADTVQEVQSLGLPYGPALMSSMACYLRDGQPLPRQGSLYAQLETLSPNLSQMLSRAVSQLVKQPLTVELLHDGTAAARTYAGHVNTAVITLGTALGVGFAPQGESLRPLDQNLILSKDLSLVLRQSQQPGCAC